MPDTPLLGLPLMSAAQAQKHVTHNEALLRLDQLIHLSVVSRSLATPPAASAEGERYIVAANPDGDWEGRGGMLALAQGGGWVFLSPRKGWRAWIEAEARLLLFDGAQWRDPFAIPDTLSASRLGVSAAADDTNRLALSSAASLFSHAGSDHRLKLNKNAPGDTASLIYQTGWSGRAEMGLTGSDDFRINVSADGAAWKQALVIDRMTGAVRLPNTPTAMTFPVLYNQSLTTQGPGFAVDSYLAGSGVVVTAGRIRTGTRYVLSFDVAKVASGVAAPVVTLRFGRSGALSDTALAVLSFPAQTALADDGRITLEATFRSGGAAASVQAVAELSHVQASGGLCIQPQAVRRAVSVMFDASVAAVMGVSVNAGAAASWSVALTQARLENLA